MGKYKIRIYSKAQLDLKDIVDYLKTQSSEMALKIYDEIVEKIMTLQDIPLRYPLARDTGLRAKGYHYLLIDSYIVFFKVSIDTAQIYRILHQRRQYKSLL